MPRAATEALLAAALAAASPSPVEQPLYTDPGGHGVVIGFRLAGPLGASGLTVLATPTMLLVQGVQAHSPAARAGVPSPERGRLRLAAVDGVAIDGMAKETLLAAFAGHDEVALTVGFKAGDDAPEELRGPYVLALTSAAAAKHAWSPEVQAARAMLAARQAIVGGEPELASEIAGHVPADSPVRAAATRLLAEAGEARQRAALSRADGLAASGNFAGAMGALQGVAASGSLGELRRVREGDWRRAIAARAALHQEGARPAAPEKPAPKHVAPAPRPAHHPAQHRRHRHR